MANAVYTNYKSVIFGGGNHGPVDWDADTIRVILVDNADYTFGASHQDLADSSGVLDTAGAASVAEANLAGVTITSGVIDADNTTLTAVSGDVAESVVLAKVGGSAATSPLLMYFDTFGSGMPVTPNGGDISVNWNASGILSGS